MSGSRIACLVVIGLVACSTFGSSSNEPPAPSVPAPALDGGDAVPDAATAEGGPFTADGYNPAADVACPDIGVCHPPQFCCIRNMGVDSCDVSGCVKPEEARLRCTDFSACAPGFVCCLRLFKLHVESVSCEPSCPTDVGVSGVYRLCGDGDSNTRCSGACVPLQKLVPGDTTPYHPFRVCE